MFVIMNPTSLDITSLIVETKIDNVFLHTSLSWKDTIIVCNSVETLLFSFLLFQSSVYFYSVMKREPTFSGAALVPSYPICDLSAQR